MTFKLGLMVKGLGRRGELIACLGCLDWARNNLAEF